MARAYAFDLESAERLIALAKEFDGRSRNGVGDPQRLAPAQPPNVQRIRVFNLVGASDNLYTAQIMGSLDAGLTFFPLADCYARSLNTFAGELLPTAIHLGILMGIHADGKAVFGIKAPGGGGGGGTLTVQEVDADPTVRDVTLIQFHQDDGLVVFDRGDGIAEIQLTQTETVRCISDTPDAEGRYDAWTQKNPTPTTFADDFRCWLVEGNAAGRLIADERYTARYMGTGTDGRDVYAVCDFNLTVEDDTGGSSFDRRFSIEYEPNYVWNLSEPGPRRVRVKRLFRVENEEGVGFDDIRTVRFAPSFRWRVEQVEPGVVRVTPRGFSGIVTLCEPDGPHVYEIDHGWIIRRDGMPPGGG